MPARKTRLVSATILLVAAFAISAQAGDGYVRIAKRTAHRFSIHQDDRALYSQDELAAIFRHAARNPLPPDPTNKVADNPRAAVLGRLLFFSRRFSANHKISCSTCHQPAHAYTDRRALPMGIAVDTRNTPTILNTAFNQWFFWDGRSDSLWSQALQPLENPSEYRGDRLHIVRVVKDDPILRKAYREVFGRLPVLSDYKRFPRHARPDANPDLAVARAWAGMTVMDQTTVNRIFSNLGKAIEAYERKLVAYNSPFDRYAAGLKAKNRALENAISPAAKRGLKLFTGKAKCELCHSGPNFTDGQFHNLGLPLRAGQRADPGREDGIRAVVRDPFNAKGRYSDDENRESGERFAFLPTPESQLGAFKTPSLRNVAMTAPYMHDGRFPSLRHVLAFYAEGEAASHGRLIGEREKTADLIPHLSDRQKTDLISFLLTLTGGPLPAKLRQAPHRR
jgi:cytochrome c peroxidase